MKKKRKSEIPYPVLIFAAIFIIAIFIQPGQGKINYKTCDGLIEGDDLREICNFSDFAYLNTDDLINEGTYKRSENACTSNFNNNWIDSNSRKNSKSISISLFNNINRDKVEQLKGFFENEDAEKVDIGDMAVIAKPEVSTDQGIIVNADIEGVLYIGFLKGRNFVLIGEAGFKEDAYSEEYMPCSREQLVELARKVSGRL